MKCHRTTQLTLAGFALLASICFAGRGHTASAPGNMAAVEEDQFDPYRAIHHDYKKHILSAVLANNKNKLDELTKQFATAHQQFVSVFVSWQDSSGQWCRYRYDPGARARAMARGPTPGAIQINWGGSDKLHVLEEPGGYVLIDSNRTVSSSADKEEAVRLKRARALTWKSGAFEDGVKIRLIVKKKES